MRTKSLLRSVWQITFGRLEYQSLKELQKAIDPSIGSLLDVGCGFNSPVQLLKHRPNRMVGVDAFAPVIEQSRMKQIHDDYHQMSVLKIEEVFGPASFDCVLATELIEHLTKEDALNLLSQMEKVARKKVVITTPNGFLAQGEEYGNPLQEHRSGWTAQEMASLGYTVIGLDGFRPLRGHMAGIEWRPRVLWTVVSLLSQSLTRVYPRWAFRLMCLKSIPS